MRRAVLLLAIALAATACRSHRDRAWAKAREVGPDAVCKDMTCFTATTDAECREVASAELETCMNETPEPATYDEETSRDWAHQLGRCTMRRVAVVMAGRGKWTCNAPATDGGPAPP